MPPPGFDDPDTDAFLFRTTRTGRTFSEWQRISTHTFDIAAAVVHSLQLSTGRPDEDLSELDSGPPLSAISTVSSLSPLTWVPATASTSTASTSSATPSVSTAPTGRQARDKARSKRKRNAQRATTKLKTDILLDARPRHPRHFTKPLSPIQASFEIRKVRIASTGWIGYRDNGVCKEEEACMVEDGVAPTHRLPDFFGPQRRFQGFQYIPYRGPTSRPMVDTAQKVCAVFGGMPDDPNFMRDVHDPAVAAMEAALRDCCVSEERCSHRRGNFPQLTEGDSMGGGQKCPGALVNGVENTRILNHLTALPAFIRLAGFATGVFANWAPRLFDFYVIYMTLLYARYTHLCRPFKNGIFSACTFNLGPRTCALSHRDFANLAFGLCAITALGDFDYKTGGHLVLWDCKLVIEFPPGCTILIPSAAIYHSNIPIGRKEHRYSFTQYTAGGLFRWVEHDFKTEEEYFASLSAEQAEEEKELGLARAEAGAGLYSTIDELRAAN
ncbi:hypothetical protein DFH08DRAFT_950500 [Mycena albidolilacea]|uniref:Uncharacterized protein n=1 Tax=Mycena albidolilacea TaxID=1033008 RepID=A0AAD7AL27_9AGAR|nr:hypothetical protein DFH08DRAFT_950500 [Mycena albidolilacea]